jgi:hypothetical protein
VPRAEAARRPAINNQNFNQDDLRPVNMTYSP